MVTASEQYWSKRATLEFNGRQVNATLAATEGGQLIVELDSEVLQDSNPDNFHKEIHGTTTDGADVTLSYVNAVTGFNSDTGYRIRSIKSVQQIEVDGIGSDPFIDEEVTIDIDVLCFMPHYPVLTKDAEVPIISRAEWEAVGTFADQIEQREEYIKSRRHAIRTSTITLSQEDQNGVPDVQIEKAQPRVGAILDIASFLLGVGCSPCRFEVTKGEGTYTRVISTHRNIGSAFTGNKLAFGNVSDLVDSAYDWYTDSTRNDYKIEQIIGYYLDSINVTRTVEGQLSTLFNGIELFAKRYSDYGPQFGSTPKRLEYIVDQLDVKVEDLAKHSKVFPDEYIRSTNQNDWRGKAALQMLSLMRRSVYLEVHANLLEQQLIRDEPIPEYFYSKTRQYIVHGDNQSTFSGRYDLLVADLESCRVLMQRLIRNQLFGNVSSDAHPRLAELEPNEFEDIDP